MLRIKTNIYSIASLLVALSVANSVVAANTYRGEWNKVNATFNVTTENIDNLKKSDGSKTSFDILLDAENKKLSDVTEVNGKSVKIFSIAYKAVIKLQNDPIAKDQIITQYGLFKSLDPLIVTQVQQNSFPQNVSIGYLKSDPIVVKFNIDGKAISSPALMTEAIDDKWMPISK